jgi:O-antigen/teichoic acid export membrane protein
MRGLAIRDGWGGRDVIGSLAVGGRRLWAWLTSSHIPGQTEAERSSERDRRAIASSLAAVAFRGSSFVVVLVSVPLTLDLLGPVRFGLWMAIASVVALLGATDLGIGNGVLNSVAHAFATGDRAAARRFLASGFAALTSIAGFLGLVFVAIYPTIPWGEVYNVTSDPLAASEAGAATAVFVATYLIGLPIGLVAQMRAAYQEGFVQSAFAGLGNLLTLLLLLFAVATHASLPILVLAITSGPLVAAIGNLFVLVRLQRPWLTPSLSDVDRHAMRSVIGIGLGFMVLQLAYGIGFSIDPLIVAHVVGPAAVSDYTVVYRLFSVPAALAFVTVLPLWPAYREAVSRQDIPWVRKTMRRSLIVTIGATLPLAVLLAIGGPGLVDLWTGGGLAPPWALYWAMGTLTVALAIANAYSVLLNGVQALRFSIGTWTLMAIANIVISVALASRIGVAGVAIGSVIAVTAALIIPDFLYVPRLMSRLERSDATQGGSSFALDA